jgi:hypothetical protein
MRELQSYFTNMWEWHEEENVPLAPTQDEIQYFENTPYI